MRKIVTYLIAIVAAAALFVSCSKEKEPKISEELLMGSWNCPQLDLTYTFNPDHTGRFYDTGGDGLPYTWSLSKDILEITVQGTGVTVKVMETYIITKQSAALFECHDEGDARTNLTFRKV